MKKLLIILLLLVSLVCSATNYYVKNGGNNSYTGLSDAQAWATIAKVNSVSFAPDDVISFNKGDTWNESVYLTPASSGTAGHPITFTSYGTGATPIIASSGLFCLYIFNKNYITISGIVFDGNYGGYANTDCTGKIAGTSSYTTITNCVFKNAYSVGLLTGLFSNYNTISYCEFYNNDRNGPGVSPRGYSIYINGSHNIIEYCISHGESSYGIHIYSGYTDTPDYNIVRYCYIYDNGSAGIIVSEGTNNEVYYNIIRNNGVYSSEGFGIRLQYNGRNTLVYNNTIYDNPSYGIYVGSDAPGTIIRNNIIYGNNGTIQNLGNATLSNNLYTNPLFLNAGGSYLLDTDFKIQSTSPARDAGTNVGLTKDYFGVTVPYNTIQDIGANEYKVPETPIAPVVIVIVSISAGARQATIGCNVTDNGGGTVSDRGVCWSTSINPTLSDSHNHNGTGTGAFNSYITGLLPNTTYHVRAFATNEAGTGYSADSEFTTTSDAGLAGDVVFSPDGKPCFVKVGGTWKVVIK